MKLEINQVMCGYGNRTILKDISFSVHDREILCLLGPNGVGKTTLFKTILGFLRLQGGDILLNGENIRLWPRERLARAIGYVPQAHTPPFPFTVLDVVTMGRTAHLGVFSSPSKKDVMIAEQAIETLNIGFLRDRIYTEISGGERQMVLIARALTQEPKLLVMDEPTSNLDFGNQIRVLQQIRELAGRGLGVIMTSHFPDHAFLCSTKIALLQKDRGFITGEADEVVTEENMRAAYGVRVKIIRSDDVKTCVPVLDVEREGCAS
ncbi:MAG TPA: iron ABC transporter ATP-binding protein [Firmicutes bacterium]|jgi:iron complex transport system ATP-binding protein|nr:iron ABC transporter ATP-binding protein [Bacillota bacterium]